MRRYLIIAAGISFFAILFVEPVRDRLSNIFFAREVFREERDIIGYGKGYNFRVEEIQKMLQGMGLYKRAPDGFMGLSTREALRKFQNSQHIRKSGYIDRKTWQELSRLKYERQGVAVAIATPTRIEPVKDAGSDKRDIYDEVINSRLNAKERVKNIQIALKNAGLDPGEIDGRMGSKTKDAVMRFQRKNGLTADGVAGAKTWEYLKEYLKREGGAGR